MTEGDTPSSPDTPIEAVDDDPRLSHVMRSTNGDVVFQQCAECEKWIRPSTAHDCWTPQNPGGKPSPEERIDLIQRDSMPNDRIVLTSQNDSYSAYHIPADHDNPTAVGPVSRCPTSTTDTDWQAITRGDAQQNARYPCRACHAWLSDE